MRGIEPRVVECAALVSSAFVWAIAAGPMTASAQAPPSRPGAPPAPRAIVLTFDDLLAQTTVPTTDVYRSVTDGLLDALDAADAPAIGFVNESKLYDGARIVDERVQLLRAWLARGHELGNHTWSHPDLHRVGVDAWIEDVDRGDEILERLWAAHPPEGRYLRHPQLRTGRTEVEKARAADRIAGLGYEIAPVTIDSQEWIFARAFDVALDEGRPGDADRVVVAYLEYMAAMTEYWERQAVRFLGRDVPHVLLLHANRLNARALPSLLDALSARGYRFVTLRDVLRDPVFERPDGYFGPRGPSWITRWMMAEGIEESALEAEPAVPAFVERLSGLGRPGGR